MNYKEKLEFCRKNSILAVELMAASSAEWITQNLEDLDVKATDEEFEEIAYLIGNAYMKSEGLSFAQIEKGMWSLLEKNVKNQKELFNEVHTYAVIEESCWFE